MQVWQSTQPSDFSSIKYRRPNKKTCSAASNIGSGAKFYLSMWNVIGWKREGLGIVGILNKICCQSWIFDPILSEASCQAHYFPLPAKTSLFYSSARRGRAFRMQRVTTQSKTKNAASSLLEWSRKNGVNVGKMKYWRAPHLVISSFPKTDRISKIINCGWR